MCFVIDTEQESISLILNEIVVTKQLQIQGYLSGNKKPNKVGGNLLLGEIFDKTNVRSIVTNIKIFH